MKILVVEDDYISRIMLEAVLNEWGYEVATAEDGAAALDIMQQADAPRLVILDWMMPGMDGLTLCRELRRQERQEPLYLILLTGRGESGDIVEGLEAGADDYIAKPYDREELRARLNVGRRLIELQVQVREREKLQGVLEMAGAVCHELNQPLQSVSGYTELLLMDTVEDDPRYRSLMEIKAGVERLGGLMWKIMNITRYQSKPYLARSRIIDIEGASLGEGGERK